MQTTHYPFEHVEIDSPYYDYDNYPISQKNEFRFCNFYLPVKQYQSGRYSRLILTRKGTLYGKGLNICGELGLGHFNKQKNWTFIPFPFKIESNSLNDEHTLIFSQGHVYGCGCNKQGQLVFLLSIYNCLGNRYC